MKTGRLLELRGASKGHLSTDRKIDLGVPTATKPLHAAHDHQSACLSQERFSGFQVFSHISQRQRKQTLTLKPVADMIGSPESQTKAIKSRQQKNRKKCLAESMPVDGTIGNNKKCDVSYFCKNLPPFVTQIHGQS